MRIACRAEVEGREARTSRHKAKYAVSVPAFSLARIVGRVAWKKDGWDLAVGGVGGKTPILTSFVKTYVIDEISVGSE